MNKIEDLKAAKDGLDIKADIARFAANGWESIAEDDVQRLKWYGVFLRNPTPGYFMVRVRIPGGRATSAQLRALAMIANTYGNGQLDMTTRQQIQLRHLQIEDVPRVFDAMDEVGLTSMQTGMDTVRNIMTCPVAGISLNEWIDTTSIVQDLNQEIVGNKAYTNLPRKFNMAMTGCLDNCLHMETQDLAFVPAKKEQDGEVIKGFNVLVGGKLGSGGYRIATALDVFVTPDEVVEVARGIILAFRDYEFRDSRTTARLAFLLEEWGEARFRVEVECRVGRSLAHAGLDVRNLAIKDHTGIFRQREAGMNYLGVQIPVGRMEADHLLEMVSLAEHYGKGEVRLAPNQSMIIPHVSDAKLRDVLEETLLKKFVYNPLPVYKGLVSCVGNDYCNLAVIETKSRAVGTAKALEKAMGEKLKPITMHWSGCPAGCGNHLVADVGLLGKKIKVNGEIVEAVDVFVGGRAGPDPKLATRLLEDVPCDQLPAVLAGVLPYHTRDKMHRVKGKNRVNTSQPSAWLKHEPSESKACA
ncbi:MAG: ferredoxin--nitrite reductase [Nitrospirota bacterium]|nr:ferredoxin--nitrite reductase [Nitrospirota bacterium]